jgi:hypothetical protein
MRLVIIYLFWGVVWDVVLNFVSTITDSENKLTSYERVYSLVLWPISFCIFMYHFVKTFFQR